MTSDSNPPGAQAFCTSCGVRATQGSLFCTSCGAALTALTASASLTEPHPRVAEVLSPSTPSEPITEAPSEAKGDSANPSSVKRRRRRAIGIAVVLAVILTIGGLALVPHSASASPAQSIKDGAAAANQVRGDATSNPNGYSNAVSDAIVNGCDPSSDTCEFAKGEGFGIDASKAFCEGWLDKMPPRDIKSDWMKGCESNFESDVFHFMNSSIGSGSSGPQSSAAATQPSSASAASASTGSASPSATSTGTPSSPGAEPAQVTQTTTPPTTTTTAPPSFTAAQQKFVDDVENQFPGLAPAIAAGGPFTTQSLVADGNAICGAMAIGSQNIGPSVVREPWERV